ncbi:MAG: ABC transporter ATP-binding protein [Myxococcales bacterium]|nr:ABC transporter ATP-binding protein [Myxococcales bacterium]MCB9521047.1 ABC transporter ATP-binding protein [Myxococcales bacterium]MCB9532457.1 ABC transporter ATP-binding protein [Myxococcales bacterium]
MAAGKDESLLELDDLRTYFFTDAGIVPSVDGVSYSIRKGRTLGVVGESGCGKSVTALSIMRLVASPPGRIVGGRVNFQGRDLTKLSEREMRHVRGNDIGMIFQEPMTSLNPVYTVGNQIAESVELHMEVGPREARERSIEVLRKVGIPSPEKRIDDYPHQMSGGMKQRVMIAMALVCGPHLLIADEPTTALDVTIQAQILDLLNGLQSDLGMSILMITHDLGVIAEVSDDVVVMYAGKVVEQASVAQLFESPRHPYTQGLFRSLPDIGAPRGGRLRTIPGMVPSPLQFPSGCRFRTRCPFATADCSASAPALRDIGGGHAVACHYADEIHAGGKAETGPYTDGRTIRKVVSAGSISEVVDG